MYCQEDSVKHDNGAPSEWDGQLRKPPSRFTSEEWGVGLEKTWEVMSELELSFGILSYKFNLIFKLIQSLIKFLDVEKWVKGFGFLLNKNQIKISEWEWNILVKDRRHERMCLWLMAKQYVVHRTTWIVSPFDEDIFRGR